LGLAKLYRFFFGVGADFGYELHSGWRAKASLPAAGRSSWRRSSDYFLFVVGGHPGGGGASGQRLLLPLCCVEGAEWVRQDVRDAEVCFAVVGDFLCAAEAKYDA
jgi:hypothetical protein